MKGLKRWWIKTDWEGLGMGGAMNVTVGFEGTKS